MSPVSAQQAIITAHRHGASGSDPITNSAQRAASSYSRAAKLTIASARCATPIRKCRGFNRRDSIACVLAASPNTLMASQKAGHISDTEEFGLTSNARRSSASRVPDRP
jgi:hypothetical protein